MSFVFFGNKTSEFCYYPIVKNAHTWGEFLFKKYLNFELTYDKNFNEKTIIIFIREPIKRWFSGAIQFLNYLEINGQPLPENFIFDEINLQIIFSAGKLDAHTELQRTFLQDFDFNKCYFFDVDESSFEEKFTHFIKNYMSINVTHDDFIRYNPMTRHISKINIKNQLEYAYNNNVKYKQQLLKYLSNDINLYNHLKRTHMYEIK